MTIEGFRKESVQRYLNNYIPIAATFGGACLGALSVACDLMGVIGSGTGLLLAVTITYGMFETIAKEKTEEGGD